MKHHHLPRFKKALLASSALALASCTVGPTYHEPTPDVPPAFGATAATSGAVTISDAATDLRKWWSGFHDPILDSLVGRAIEANHDLRVAESRVREARARRAVVAGGRYPDLRGQAGYSRTRISENGLPLGGPPQRVQASPTFEGRAADQSSDGGIPSQESGAFGLLPEFNLYQLGFDSSWEIDLFGRISRQIEASDANLGASVEEYRGALISLISEVARGYMELRGFQRAREIAEKNLQSQREVLELTKNQVQNGVATDLDVTRAEAQVRTTEAEIPAFRQREELALHQIGVLLAQPPTALAQELGPVKPLPSLPSKIDVGIPADLIRRRPDLRRAERELASATALVGLATENLYPSFTIGGAFSFASAEPSTLFDWSSRGYSVGPNISIPLFQGGALDALRDVRNEQLDQAWSRYQSAVLTALREVEDGIVAFSNEQERHQSLVKAVAAQRESVRLARELYREGLGDFLTVLEAQRAQFAAEDALAASERTAATDLIAIYKALGGGWEEEAGGAAGSKPV